jgi:hypothetical protein
MTSQVRSRKTCLALDTKKSEDLLVRNSWKGAPTALSGESLGAITAYEDTQASTRISRRGFSFGRETASYSSTYVRAYSTSTPILFSASS